MSSNSKTTSKKSRFKLLHQYYSYTGFYKFVRQSMVKSLLPIGLFVFALIMVHHYLIDFNELFTSIVNTYSPAVILGVFFVSESFLGLVPPEIFIAWAGKSSHPMLYLTLLAILSYTGGIISFFIGKSISKLPSVYNYLEVKMEKHIKMIRKWGGFLIVVGALLPIPFSITSIAAGIINYKFRNYILFGLLRFVRFYLYALVIFNVV
ncbi:YqaA family protein [Urechidicola vernalis]|uniref:VTT domain-containing protein n=1 Tax=Urechidicola vernalis TaxID=3075600 RepID=A0ABU2Y1R1_9FLAO|nr:VTT domain-containing protein [Urechidicola sp. P050]MDT0551952.1 VTT domain-containing protein [Urechidicola sp. P050]